MKWTLICKIKLHFNYSIPAPQRQAQQGRDTEKQEATNMKCILYNQLLMSEKLYPHLIEIDRTARERMDAMLPHMMEVAGVTEELKACDPMRWVGLMNTLTAQIEEILIRELICS